MASWKLILPEVCQRPEISSPLTLSQRAREIACAAGFSLRVVRLSDIGAAGNEPLLYATGRTRAAGGASAE